MVGLTNKFHDGKRRSRFTGKDIEIKDWEPNQPDPTDIISEKITKEQFEEVVQKKSHEFEFGILEDVEMEY